MNLRLLALAGFALAAALVVDGHLDPNGNLNPWSLTVSDFAVSDRGGVVDWAMVVMAAASGALLLALHRTGVRIEAWVAGLFAVWAAGLTVAAIVPTDAPGLALSAAGSVHRYASVAAFVALPVAGWRLAQRVPHGRAVRALAAVSVGCALAMVYSAFPGDRVLIGLAERLLLVAEAGLLVALALPQRYRKYSS
ncbi:DUF998 domain-containing protein [Dactylosporangium sp. CA-139066]|uniref:DUF998 domain-containing protein n=1 Tax=Dactylosporangium sp. CA-139066 TaxID=3239930 RepID=UPI003D8A3A93